jgi:hypothetical protein
MKYKSKEAPKEQKESKPNSGTDSVTQAPQQEEKQGFDPLSVGVGVGLTGGVATVNSRRSLSSSLITVTVLRYPGVSAGSSKLPPFSTKASAEVVEVPFFDLMIMDTLFDALQFNNDLAPDLLIFASNLGLSTKSDLLIGCVPINVVAVVVSAAVEVI